MSHLFLNTFDFGFSLIIAIYAIILFHFIFSFLWYSQSIILMKTDHYHQWFPRPFSYLNIQLTITAFTCAREEIANLIWAIQILFRSFIGNIFDCQVLDNLNLVIDSPKIFCFCFPISWIKSIRKNNIAFWNLMQSF